MKWLFKLIVKGLFKLFYRVEVQGIEHYHAVDQAEQPLLIISNHVSTLDGPLLDLFIPGETTFMVDASHTEKWYERFILSMSHYFTVDLHNPYAAKHMIEELKKGKQCMIFPEGRITTTGSLMKVYEGTAMVAQKTGAAVLPIHISGAVYSKFSYLDGTKFAFMKQFWFPKIILSLQPAQKINPAEGLKGHAKHQFLNQQVFRLLRDGGYYASVKNKTLFSALLLAKSTYRNKEVCVEDINKQSLNLKKLTLASIILGKVFVGRTFGDGGGKRLVGRQVDTENLGPVHALKSNQIARLVGDGNAHGNLDRPGLADRSTDQFFGLIQGQAFDGQHERHPPKIIMPG